MPTVIFWVEKNIEPKEYKGYTVLDYCDWMSECHNYSQLQEIKFDLHSFQCLRMWKTFIYLCVLNSIRELFISLYLLGI